MRTYKDYGPRPPGLPLWEGIVDFGNRAGVQQMLQLIGDAPLPPVVETAEEKFVGVTTGGLVVPDLFTLKDEGFDPRPAAIAARAYLSSLSEELRVRASSPIDSSDWQLWTNAFLTYPEHGLRLQDLEQGERGAALQVMRSSLSSVGFDKVRGAMRLNGELGEFLGEYLDSLTEWCYWFTIFGNPSEEGPWGWQLAGHHVDVHCLILGRQAVLTPTFLGAEFRSEQLFCQNRTAALEFVNSLDAAQRSRAVLYDSITSGDLPQHLAGAVDGRHRAGAGRDNVILPYEGLRADQLGDHQQELLLAMIEPHIDLLPADCLSARREQVAHHVADSWVSWMGGTSTDDPFYYKVHSPVVLVEYDNHPGIFIGNDEPEPFHVHTIVRTPNGGDYGKNLLAQHYTQHHRA